MTSTIKKRQTIHRQVQQNELHIKHLEQQIRATQKLASLGTMACLVAHEFNNILVPLIGYSEHALKHDDDIDLMRKALHKTVKHGNRAAMIVQSMLGLVRDQAEDRQPVSVASVVQDCFQCLARDLQKDRITVRLDIPPDLTACVAPGQLQQVLLNLIINARQAMLDRGGTLTIQVRSLDSAKIKIEVTDTGCGIEPDVLDKIFQPFFTTKADASRPDRQGTGLGLSVCKDIVEAYHGRIDVTSRPAHGTIFTITLPAV